MMSKEEESLQTHWDELREKFLKKALQQLPSMTLSLKAELSKKTITKKLKSDCCQVCGLNFSSETMKTKVRRNGKGKKKTLKIVIFCDACKSEASGVALPKAINKQSNSQEKTYVEKKVQQKPSKPIIKKSDPPLPQLTQRQKQANRASRLGKMVAAMEKSQPPSTASSLDAFLSSLG